MKAREIVEVKEVVVVDNSEKIKAAIRKEWDLWYTAEEIAECIEHGFIFGIYGQNEHYQKEYILNLISQVEAEFAPVIEEVIPEFVPEEKVPEIVLESIPEPLIDAAPEEVFILEEPPK